MTKFQVFTNTKVINLHPDDQVLTNGAKLLQRDIAKVVTTSGPSNVIRLKKEVATDLRDDNFKIVAVSDTVLEVQAATSLGVMYGVLAISREALGIEDAWYFLDMEPTQKERAVVDTDQLRLPDYHVKYRGWFVNDEVMISHWQDYGSNQYVWYRIYETLLRFGGNIIIAGTDKNSHANRKSANAFGLMTTHHHAEPLGAQMFAREYPDLEASYLKYPELFEAIWQASIEEQKDSQVIWSLGFRGQGDRPFWKDDDSREWTEQAKADVINSVIQLQYDMVKAAVPNAICAVNIYGELAKMFQEDLLQLPKDVLEIWADNGYGKMVSRRQENDDPRTSILSTKNKLNNRRGIYYHVAFHDLQASNFLTKLPNSPAFVSRELEAVRKVGMNKLVITNTGNIKPHILFLREVGLSWLTDYQERSDSEIFDDYMRYYPETFKEEIKEVYLTFFDCFVQYGGHEDQKAGDEFYTYTIRKIVQTIVKKGDQLESMKWLTGERELSHQLNFIKELIQPKMARWERQYVTVRSLYQRMMLTDQGAEIRLYNDLFMDTAVHYYGIRGLYSTILAAEEVIGERLLHGFLRAYEAKEAIDGVLKVREENPSRKWVDFYDNDVFTNMAMTKRMLASLMQYIRLIGDNHEQYQWERDYLMEKGDSIVMLLSNTHDALSDDYLAEKLYHLLEE